MSHFAIKKLADDTIRDADRILKLWVDAARSGDITKEDTRRVTDTLLDLRVAADLVKEIDGARKKVPT